jgi:hypothetical protein
MKLTESSKSAKLGVSDFSSGNHTKSPELQTNFEILIGNVIWMGELDCFCLCKEQVSFIYHFDDSIAAAAFFSKNSIMSMVHS